MKTGPTARHHRLRLLGLLSAGAICIGCVPMPHDTVPTSDGTIETTAAGSVLDVEPWSGHAPSGAVVQSVTFATRDAADTSISSHALVVSPTTSSNGRILVWEHGTTGVESSCSPSLLPGWLRDGGIPGLETLLGAGWTIVAPDYADPDVPRRMPYLVGEGQARATLDAVRATLSLAQGALSNDIVVWGHSQGGHAALWVPATAKTYAPEVVVDSVVAFAPPVDVNALLQPQRSPVGATIIGAWVAAGYDSWYGDDSASESYATSVAGTMTEIASRCVFDSSSATEQQGLQRIAGGDDGAGPTRMQPAFAERLRQNVPVGSPGVRTLVVWGSDDEVVPPDTTAAWVDERKAAGDDIEARAFPDEDHSSIVGAGSASLALAEQWIEAEPTAR